MAKLTAVPVYRDRKTTITVNLNYDVTGDTLTAQGREGQASTSTLLVTFTVVVNTANTGALTLTCLPAAIEDEAVDFLGGWMDIKRVSAGVPLPAMPAVPFIFDELPTA